MPVRVYAANLDFTQPRRNVRRHLDHLLATRPVIIGAQEAKRFALTEVVRVGVRAVVRQRRSTPARRGTAIISRGVKVGRLRLFLGGVSRATLPRFIATVPVRLPSGGVMVVLSAHVPPRRAGAKAQDAFLDRLATRLDRLDRKGVAWVVCIDANRDLATVARYLGGRGYGADGDRIVGVIASPRVKVADSGVSRFGRDNGLTDHLAPWIDVAFIEPKE